MKIKNLITEEEKKEIRQLHEDFDTKSFFDMLGSLFKGFTGDNKEVGKNLLDKFTDKVDKGVNLSDNDLPKNIVIGDSQTPYVANGSEKFELISSQGSESSLWLGSKTLSWLLSAVKKHKGSDNVKNIAICIGTNGAFNPNDNITGLVEELEIKFPNAKLFVIQGSWGWGGLSNISETKVRNYYSIFEDNGVKVIEPPIGDIEPHGNKPIYKVIGKNLDNEV